MQSEILRAPPSGLSIKDHKAPPELSMPMSTTNYFDGVAREAWLRWRAVVIEQNTDHHTPLPTNAFPQHAIVNDEKLTVVAGQRSAVRPVCGVAQRHSIYEVVAIDMDAGSSGGPCGT